MPDDVLEWMTGFDEDTRNYVIGRGLDKKPVGEVIAETIKAHRNAESKLGAPADQMVRWPAAEDSEGWKAIHTRLGVPATPAEYKFDTVKYADGKAPEAEFTDWMRSTAAELKLPASAAETLAQRFIKHGEDAKAQTDGADRLKVAVQQDQLKLSWGANFDNNKFIADRAAQLLGLPADTLNALANTANYPAVMDGLLKVGRAMGESKLLGVNDGPGSNPNGTMTREEAQSRLDDVTQGRNRDLAERWYKGDAKAVEEVTQLTKLAVGQR